MNTTELIEIARECGAVSCGLSGSVLENVSFMRSELKEFAERIAPQWQPIESAPKDGTRVLLKYDTGLFAGAGYDVVAGRYDLDTYAKNPRPYWKNDLEKLRGITTTRAIQPTHWQPIPPPPRGEK